MDREYIKQNAAASGSCAENFNWYFLEGNLYIEGTGMLEYVEDWAYFYDPPASEYCKRNKPVIHPWKEWIPQIRHIEIADGCTELGLGCFENHYALETVALPNTVRKIGIQAFSACGNLKEMVLPESVEEIDDLAFYGCIAMTCVTIPVFVKRIGYQSFAYCKELADIAVPRNIAEIGDAAFYGVSHITYHGKLESDTIWGGRSRN